jgi:hypothetical protein
MLQRSKQSRRNQTAENCWQVCVCVCVWGGGVAIALRGGEGNVSSSGCVRVCHTGREVTRVDTVATHSSRHWGRRASPGRDGGRWAAGGVTASQVKSKQSRRNQTAENCWQVVFPSSLGVWGGRRGARQERGGFKACCRHQGKAMTRMREQPHVYALPHCCHSN